MRNRPFISVIMPVYNGEKYLQEAIDSVLAQTYTNFELLLINDGSTDNSKEIILSYKDSRIRYIENEKNLKLIATLNKGIDLAEGYFIARMDADDVCMPRRFEKQVAFLNKHTEIDMCGTWAIRIDAHGRATGKIKNIDSPELLKCATFFTCPFIHPSTMFKASVLKKHKYNHDFKDTEDTELWHRLSLNGYRLANIPEYLLKYRWHGENISAKKEEYIFSMKKKIFQPALEKFFNSTVSEEDLNLHLYSFSLYHFGERQTEHSSLKNLDLEKKYFEKLFSINNSEKMFSTYDWAAFLFSRWIVCCVANKLPLKALSIKVPWYNPIVLYRTLKLLIYK